MSGGFWSGKRVLVTGAGGFVGPYLADHLLRSGAGVVGQIRRRSDGQRPRSLVNKGIVDEVEIIEADLNDIYSMASLMDRAKPDVIFHLAAQSFVHHSFAQPIETVMVNSLGTESLLEVVRLKGLDPLIVFAGSSEQYGLVFASDADYERARKRYGAIYPEPGRFPELPIKESNPLRPMSPYAVSKTHGELLMRNYNQAYGVRTIVSRAFNHEGAGRGQMFVTSAIARQVIQLKFGEVDRILIGNVNAFRDWSHVRDVVRGYCLLAERGTPGEVYNQGSMQTNSVLSFILLSLEGAGWEVRSVRASNGDKEVPGPTATDVGEFWGTAFEKTLADRMLLENKLEYVQQDEAIVVDTDRGDVLIELDPSRFRRAEVPILLCDPSRIRELGLKSQYRLRDIIQDQLNFYLSDEERRVKLLG